MSLKHLICKQPFYLPSKKADMVDNFRNFDNWKVPDDICFQLPNGQWQWQYHPQHLHQWYTVIMPLLTDSGALLKGYSLKKKFEELSEPIPLMIQIIINKPELSFGLGWYEWAVTMKPFEGMWPAIWLYEGFEIDVIERYVNKKWWGTSDRSQSNVHHASNTGMIGPRTHRLKKGNLQSFQLFRGEDYILFGYNGKVVRKIMNDNIYADITKPLRVIISTGWQAYMADQENAYQELYVHYMKYWKL